jgi:hypothetical protein
MNITYILTIAFMIIIFILGVIGLSSPDKIVKYYSKYRKNDPNFIKVINKNWFYPSLRISSILFILYSITVIFLIIGKIFSLIH